jgi:capping protein (actin filament) muscle Z-line, alpha
MSSTVDIASSFIRGAPPGELSNVVEDIKTLTSDDDPSLISKLKPAFQKYNEEQLTTTKLPGSSQPVCVPTPRRWEGRLTGLQVLVSQYNKLPDGRYYDTETNTSFEFNHITQVSQTYSEDLISTNSPGSAESILLPILHSRFTPHHTDNLPP